MACFGPLPHYLEKVSIFVSVESFNDMFWSSSPLLRKSEPPVQVQDTIITAWTIRHSTGNRNDPIARAELYQLSYIPQLYPPEPSGACMKESDAYSDFT